MDQTQKLLGSVVESARTGLDACEQLLRRAQDAAVREELMDQCARYQSYARDAERALFAAGGKPSPKGAAARAGLWMGLQMNTLTDVTPSHIADIAIQGATMGVIGMTKDRNDLPDADANAQGIASAYIAMQQENIERLKSFL
ncbi:MAG: hypothetical protein ACI4MF_09585 [Candidatus Faecivicinus sp.]